jgi:hypothetical protein
MHFMYCMQTKTNFLNACMEDTLKVLMCALIVSNLVYLLYSFADKQADKLYLLIFLDS